MFRRPACWCQSCCQLDKLVDLSDAASHKLESNSDHIEPPAGLPGRCSSIMAEILRMVLEAIGAEIWQNEAGGGRGGRRKGRGGLSSARPQSSFFSLAVKPLLVGSAIWTGPLWRRNGGQKLGVAMLYCPSLLPADGSGRAAGKRQGRSSMWRSGGES